MKLPRGPGNDCSNDPRGLVMFWGGVYHNITSPSVVYSICDDDDDDDDVRRVAQLSSSETQCVACTSCRLRLNSTPGRVLSHRCAKAWPAGRGPNSREALLAGHLLLFCQQDTSGRCSQKSPTKHRQRAMQFHRYWLSWRSTELEIPNVVTIDCTQSSAAPLLGRGFDSTPP